MKAIAHLWNKTLLLTETFVLLIGFVLLASLSPAYPSLYAQDTPYRVYLPQVHVPARAGEPGNGDDPPARASGTIAFWACNSRESIGETQSCEIYTIQGDGTNQMRLTNNTAYDGDLAWSPDGTRIAFVSDRDGQRELYVMNADGTNQTRLTNNTTIEAAPDWSPDGTRIAFATGTESEGIGQILVINADGTNQTHLTNNERWNHSPEWSPDGTRLAFASTNNWDTQITVMLPDGTQPITFTGNQGFGRFPVVWSPDSTRLAFDLVDNESPNDGASNLEIGVSNADGTNQRHLTQDGGGQPDWSPDGTRIAFFSDRHYNAEIYVINTDGSQERRLTSTDTADNFSPDWSPDGTRIAFVSTRDGNDEIYIMNADGTNQTRITNDSLSVEYPIWAPVMVPLME